MTEPMEEPIKKGRGQRGKSAATVALLEQCVEIIEERAPIGVRGVCYPLFVRKALPSMAKKETNKISRLLVYAREQSIIKWEDIVDESRRFEGVQTWRNLGAFAETVQYSYRRDFWASQPYNVQVWSEKATVGGILRPVTDEYGVPFIALHGFGSTTIIQHEAARSAQDTERELVILYCGDWDPSGMYMSEMDIPRRFAEYGGRAIIRRIALTPEDLPGLPSFPAADKKDDTRLPWFIKHYGAQAWELDAMNPNALRDRVEAEILSYINTHVWQRMRVVEDAEQATVRRMVGALKGLES